MGNYFDNLLIFFLRKMKKFSSFLNVNIVCFISVTKFNIFAFWTVGLDTKHFKVLLGLWEMVVIGFFSIFFDILLMD